MSRTIALVPTRLETTALGLRSRAAQPLAGRSVLERTVIRLARVGRVEKIVLLHGDHDDPLGLLGGQQFGVPVCSFRDPGGLAHPYEQKHAAARKWAMAAWRGGLGGATCYDELLPAASWQAAMDHHGADAALVVGADWPLVDPDYCRRVVELHVSQPKDMQMTFTQAPPGLAGIAIGRDLVGQLAQNHACMGQLIAYNPAKPQADPIGRDVCVQIPASVRSFVGRFIYDTPATAARIDQLADQMGDRFQDADADAIIQAAASLGDHAASGFARLPQMITLELTPRRCVSGPVTAQHHVQLDRDDMPLDTALNIVGQMGDDQHTALTLGGLGDALLYEPWQQVVAAAHQAGVLGIAIETDLLVGQPVLEKLLELPIDVVSIRLNADTAQTYRKVMDPQGTLDDGFARVIKNLEWLFNQRNRRTRQLLALGDVDSGEGGAGLPWIVPRLMKTADTFNEMESFFDKWLYYAGHAVIEPATSGCGLAPDASPVPMAPPGRFGCRQVTCRLTIHSDGRVAQCDQDWLGTGCGGDATITPLADIWRSMRSLRQAHAQGQWDRLALCSVCHEWHRP